MAQDIDDDDENDYDDNAATEADNRDYGDNNGDNAATEADGRDYADNNGDNADAADIDDDDDGAD